MAIYGDFADHAFPDIVKVLQKHTGRLFLQSALGGKSVELHLDKGMLYALFIDGFPVRDILRVQDTLRQLLNGATGTYEFETSRPEELNKFFSLPLAQALRSLIQDARIDESQLPHEATKFIITPQAEKNASGLPTNLQIAWRKLAPVFGQGGNATEVSEKARISISEAKLMIFHFRSAEIITPYRAAVQNQQQTSVTTNAPMGGNVKPEKKGPMQRFLSALRRFTGGR